MLRRWTWVMLGALACLPRPHDPLGRTCEQASDCGAGYVCWQARCAVAGSVGTLSIGPDALSAAHDEGGLARTDAGLARVPVQRASLDGWTLDAPLPAPRTGHRVTAVGRALVLTGGADAVGPSADAWVVAGVEGSGRWTWTSAAALPAARVRHAACAWGERVFVLGGSDTAGQPTKTVWTAVVGADGALSTWTDEAPLPTAREGSACLAAAGALWLLGGAGAAGVTDEILVNHFRPDGSLGTWEVAGALSAGRTHHAVIARVGTLFVVGGSCSSGGCEPLSAPLDEEGTLGPFRAWPGGPSPRDFAAIAESGGSLLVAGGRTAAGVEYDEVWTASLGASGAVSNWSLQGALPAPLGQAASVVVGQAWYLLGGDRGGAPQQDAVRTSLRDRATATSFASLEPLPGNRCRAPAVSYGGGLYLVGGETAPNVVTGSILRADLSDGGLGGWTDAGALPVPFRDGEAAALAGTLYVVGGLYTGAYGGAETGVWAAPLGAAGTVGPFTPTTALPEGRQNAGVAVAGGRLYVSGGRPSETDDGTTTVWFSAPNLDGGLGAWVATTPLPQPRAAHRMVAARNHLYVLGGLDGTASAYSGQVWSAPLLADGAVGAWNEEPAFQGPRAFLGAAAADDALLVFSGCNDGAGAYCENFLSDVQVADVAPSGRLSAWRALAASVDGRRDFGVATVGDSVFAVGGRKFGPLSPVEVARVGGHAGTGTWQPLPALPSAVPDALVLAAAGRVLVQGGAAVVSAAPLRGAVTSWSLAPDLPVALRGAAGAASASRIYVLGGDEAGQPSARVYSAAVSAQAVGGWREERALPQALRAGCAALDRGRLFVLGGEGSASSWVSALDADGVAGAWQPARALPAARWQHGCLAYGHRLYVVAGQGAAGPTTEVHVAAISEDGTLGDWQRTTALAEGRLFAAVAAQDGWLYLLGGQVGGRDSGDVLAAPFEADGALGDFIALSSRLDARRGPGAAVVDGWLYAAGGSADVALATAQAAPLHAPNARGAFSVRADMGFWASSIDALGVHFSAPVPGAARFGARVSTEDARFDSFRPLGALDRDGELRVDSPGRQVWLWGALDEGASACRGPPQAAAVDALTFTYRR